MDKEACDRRVGWRRRPLEREKKASGNLLDAACANLASLI
jgi:hypothetical protein